MNHAELSAITQLPAAERGAAIDAHRGEIEAVLAEAMGWKENRHPDGDLMGWVDGHGESKPGLLRFPGLEVRPRWHPLTDPAHAAMVAEQMVRGQGWDFALTYARHLDKWEADARKGLDQAYVAHPVSTTAESLAWALAFLKMKEGE